MKVWIVCDNNVTPSVMVFKTLKKAQKYVNKYDGFKAEDCWIFDKKGNDVK